MNSAIRPKLKTTNITVLISINIAKTLSTNHKITKNGKEMRQVKTENTKKK